MNGKKIGLMAGAGLFTALAVAPSLAFADSDSQQKNKNLWRNVTIGAGAVAAHGLLRHNTTETIVGAAGTAYAANRYEHDRHNQSVDRDRRRARQAAAYRRYHRYHRYHRSY